MNFEIAPQSTERQLKWNDAKMYCFSLTIDGKTGWRLPTIEELEEISQSENKLLRSYYWSSEVYDDRRAWLLDVMNLNKYRFQRDDGHFFCRAVRDLKDN
jgi:formylglycine-generating enzyme required for sulfatase activity